MTGITPRGYQLEALEEILSKKESGITRQLVQLPTGCGKTIIFALLAKELNVKTLIIAHREQLISQAVDKISMVWPEAEIGVCMAERNEIGAQIVVASVQSASQPNRIKLLKEENFGLIVVDEAHHATAASYTILFEQLGFLRDDPQKLLVGVTATPSRKGGGLGDVFQEIVFDRSLSTMIKGGFLCELRGERILTPTSINAVSTSNGDFADGQLSEVCNSEARNDLIADSFVEYCPDRKGIVFCCDVKHTIDLAEAFKSKGIVAHAIYGAMKPEEKNNIMRQFSFGEIQVLTNCALLIEGYDEPAINAVIMARPTKSKNLYTQCIGRGTRLHPSKSDCLILDFCDNYHNMESIATLDKTVCVTYEDDSSDGDAKTYIKSEKRPHSVYVGREYVGEFAVLDRSKYAWTPVKNHWHLLLSPELSLWLKEEDGNFTPIVCKDERQKPLLRRSVSLEYAMGVAEDFARKRKKINPSFCDKNAAWRFGEPTQKQIETLQKMGIDGSNLSKGEATQLISQKINERNLWKLEPATERKIHFIKSQGFKCPPQINKNQANEIISWIKEKVF